MNKKGITPVIATILLLLMTVAAAGTAYFWMVSVQSKIQTGVSTGIEQQLTQAQYQINLVGVVCNNTTYKPTVMNIGPNDIPAGNATLVVTNGTTGATIAVSTTSSSTLTRNNVTTLTFTVSINMGAGNITGVKITLPGGVEGSASCTLVGGNV
ncbi:MAG: hypothetical protein OH354_02545 [Candidatus Parvarchaeota archaeon]|nr:hypothetical protein [Candidatus Jingweiarchaeum tengchongense]MCW1304629.1 hypothetical protein [Candidatus Jingweiarchaeum tengchongense]MCW1309662.1 hypothetical protein [Candidatus Jingweiarchaeum tengchongense]MCW1311027.1 hypothetical protein [Candidatus Jingweiarchaeum tengchongense]